MHVFQERLAVQACEPLRAKTLAKRVIVPAKLLPRWKLALIYKLLMRFDELGSDLRLKQRSTPYLAIVIIQPMLSQCSEAITREVFHLTPFSMAMIRSQRPAEISSSFIGDLNYASGRCALLATPFRTC